MGVCAPSSWIVGHSRHSVARFLNLLEGQGIACVVDVRSVPFIRRHPQHSRLGLPAARIRGVRAMPSGLRYAPPSSHG